MRKLADFLTPKKPPNFGWGNLLKQPFDGSLDFGKKKKTKLKSLKLNE